MMILAPDKIKFDKKDLIEEGLIALTEQMNNLYQSEVHIKKYYDPKTKDLTVGPFFLKNLKSPYPSKEDTGSIKIIKGRMFDVFRASDLMKPGQRKKLSKLDKFIDKYTKTKDEYPDDETIMDELKLTKDELKKIRSSKVKEESVLDSLNNLLDSFESSTKCDKGYKC